MEKQVMSLNEFSHVMYKISVVHLLDKFIDGVQDAVALGFVDGDDIMNLLCDLHNKTAAELQEEHPEFDEHLMSEIIDSIEIKEEK